MSREDAASLINLINSMQPYVPPIVFAPIASLRASAILSQIATGQIVSTLSEPQKSGGENNEGGSS